MGSFIFIFIFSVLFSFQCSFVKATYPGCHTPKSKCSDVGPEIQYPFHLKGHNPLNETLPGFELFCKGNLTTIHFPNFGDLVVKSISTDTKMIISLIDPKNCVHSVFLNLNLSLTPFHYYHVVKNYTYLNCSKSLSHPFIEVPCLSGSYNFSHVYTVGPEMNVPDSCKGFKTVAIPFGYSPYLSDNSFGLELTWDLPQSQQTIDTNQTTKSHTARYTVIGLSICLLLVAIALVSVKVNGSKTQKEGRLLQSSPCV